VLAAAGTGAWLALAADEGTLVRANAAAAACAAAALAVGLALRFAPAIPLAVALLGVEYVALLGFEGEAIDLRAPLVAAALYSVAELGYWSLELHGPVADEPGTHLRRVTLLAGFLLATVALGVGLLALVEAVTARGAALDALGAEGTWELGGRALKVTNLDKVLFPGRDGEPPVTKRELLRYHALIAPWMLPYLHDRPVNVHRYPNGAGAKGFWQKARPDHAPDWITAWRNLDADEGETEVYSVLDSMPSLVWAANLAAFEIHPWTSAGKAQERPTWALIDVDPGPETTHQDLLLMVRLHRTALAHLGVEACPKTSGKRGFQIWIPVEPRYTFDETRAWVEKLSKAVGASIPDLVSWKWTKDDRGGLARLDYTQNAINKTLVAPFSVRPAPGAPVSMPIAWDELDDDALTSDRWTIRTALDRLAERGDPLAPLIGRPQRLPSL